MRRAAVLASLERLKRYLRDIESDTTLLHSDHKTLRDFASDADDHRRHLEEAIRTIKRHWKSDAGLP